MHPKPEPHDAVYVVVRTDISPRQQTVQAVHAGMEAALNFPNRDAFLSVLAAKDEDDLARIARLFDSHGIGIAAFEETEPALGVTSFGTALVPGALRRFFSSIPSWREAVPIVD